MVFTALEWTNDSLSIFLITCGNDKRGQDQHLMNGESKRSNFGNEEVETGEGF